MESSCCHRHKQIMPTLNNRFCKLTCDDMLPCRGFQNNCNVTASLLGLEAFNGTDSVIELEQYDAVTPGAATNQEAAALHVITSGK